MDRNKLRDLFCRAKNGEAIAGDQVVELMNYLAIVEFEVDCRNLDWHKAAEKGFVRVTEIPRTCYPGHVLLRLYPDGNGWACNLEHRANGLIQFAPTPDQALSKLAFAIGTTGMPESTDRHHSSLCGGLGDK